MYFESVSAKNKVVKSGAIIGYYRIGRCSATIKGLDGVKILMSSYVPIIYFEDNVEKCWLRIEVVENRTQPMAYSVRKAAEYLARANILERNNASVLGYGHGDQDDFVLNAGSGLYSIFDAKLLEGGKPFSYERYRDDETIDFV